MWATSAWSLPIADEIAISITMQTYLSLRNAQSMAGSLQIRQHVPHHPN